MLRGGAGMVFPDHGSGGNTVFGADVGTGSASQGSGPRTSFVANVAPGYYFTPHDLAPFGDLVW